MAALTITAANVLGSAGPTKLAGATITAGQAVRLSGDTVIPAVNDNAANANVYGVALNGGAAGQPIAVQQGGDVTIGATVAVGKWYVLGTAGGIIPVDDIAGAEFPSLIGFGQSAALLTLHLIPKAVAAAGAVA